MTIDQSGKAGWSEDDVRDAAVVLARRHPRIVEEAWQGWRSSRNSVDLGSFETSNFVRDAMIDADPSSPFGKFWNLTRQLSLFAKGNKPTIWNRLLRTVLDAGIIVDRGSGLIHRYEPLQVLFLTRKALDVESMIPNVWDWIEGKEHGERTERAYRALEEIGLTNPDYDLGEVVRMIPSDIEENIQRFAQLAASHPLGDWVESIRELEGAMLEVGSDGVRIHEAEVHSMAYEGQDWISFQGCVMFDMDIKARGEFERCRFKNSTFYIDESTVGGIDVEPLEYRDEFQTAYYYLDEFVKGNKMDVPDEVVDVAEEHWGTSWIADSEIELT